MIQFSLAVSKQTVLRSEQ